MEQMGLDTEATAPESKGPQDIAKLDLEIAVKLGTRLLKDAGGLDALRKGVQSSADAPQVVAKFLVQLIMKIKDTLSAQQIQLTPEIVLADGGWIEQMLDVIEKELKLPPEFSDNVVADVMETFKALAQSEAKGEQQPAAAGPPQAQGGMQ